jgi:WD40 repeat protein
MRLLEGHRRAVRCLAFAPRDSALLASGGDDRTVLLWDCVGGAARACLRGHSDAVLALAFSPDGERLASGGREGTLNVWLVAEGRREWGVYSSSGPILSLSFSADGESLLAAVRPGRLFGESGQLLLWDVHPGREAGRLPWSCGVETALYSPDGAGVAVTTVGHEVALWDAGLERPLVARTVAGRARCVAFAPDGRTLGVANGCTVEVCRLPALLPRAFGRGHRGEVHALAFAPDGRTLLSGAGDRTVRLWETASGREVAAYNWQQGPVEAVAFAPDGLTAAAAGHKPRVVLWDVGG